MPNKTLTATEQAVANAIHKVRAQVEQQFREDMLSALGSQRSYDVSRHEARCAVIREIALKVGAAMARQRGGLDINEFVEQCVHININTKPWKKTRKPC